MERLQMRIAVVLQAERVCVRVCMCVAHQVIVLQWIQCGSAFSLLLHIVHLHIPLSIYTLHVLHAALEIMNHPPGKKKNKYQVAYQDFIFLFYLFCFKADNIRSPGAILTEIKRFTQAKKIVFVLYLLCGTQWCSFTEALPTIRQYNISLVPSLSDKAIPFVCTFPL